MVGTSKGTFSVGKDAENGGKNADLKGLHSGPLPTCQT